MIIRRPGTRRAYAICPYGLPAECPCASVFNLRTPTEREFDVGQFIYIGMGLPLHDGCKLPCRGSASYLARCLQACLHGVCKPACTVSASLLARWLQACLHDGCKLPCTMIVSHWEGCLPRGGKGVFPEAGRVSSSRREGCLPRGGEGVFPEAGRVSPPRRGGCLPRGGEMDSLHRTHVTEISRRGVFDLMQLPWGKRKQPRRSRWIDGADFMLCRAGAQLIISGGVATVASLPISLKAAIMRLVSVLVGL